MTTLSACFAQSYAEARSKFLAAAEAAQLDVQSHAHPMLGRNGEALAIDVVCDGPQGPEWLLVVTSGCHGVEGFCGSGIQVALLGDAAWRDAAHAAGVVVLYAHALNPYGFSWWRRTTHENVDLNRNFLDFSQPLPRNDAYDAIAALLVPPNWPSPDTDAALQRFVAANGLAALQAAVSGGQYDHPQGLFYGGRNPTWSHQVLRAVLRQHGAHARRAAWIDLHTGLGPRGVGERILACRHEAAALARARAWWGEAVTSVDDGSSTSAPLTGMMWTALEQACPQAEYTGIALEFGTVPSMEVLQALRAEQWLENHPETPPDVAAAIKQRMRDAFYIDTDDWKASVVEQAREAAQQAVQGLASDAGWR